MSAFKVPCPSCEAPVLIKDPKLIGTKVECPKCKYRFKVEEPAAAAADAKKPDAGKKKPDADRKADKKKEKAAAAPGKNKKFLKIGAGVGAILLLVVVGVLAFGGGNDKKTGGGAVGKVGGSGGTGGTENPDGTPGEPKGGQKVDPGAPQTASSTRNATNLLPAQAVAVYRLNFDRLRESTLYEALTGQQVEGAFQSSMGFPLTDVETYIHCFAGEQRVPYGVLKLRTPAPPAETTKRMQETNTLQPTPKELKGHKLFAIRSNPFVNALSNALAMRSVFGEFYDRVPGERPDAANRPMGLCVYDNQHVLLGDYALLEKFLNDLGPDGYPTFQTLMVSASAPAPMAGASDKPVTSSDTYRTIEFPLKKALDEMEGNRLPGPMLVYAEKFDLRQYDPKLMKKEYDLISTVLEPIARRTRYLGANLVAFTPNRFVATLRIMLGSESESREVAKNQLVPDLQALSDRLKLFLTSQVMFTDFTEGGSTAATTTGIPGSPYQMGGYPGMGMPGMGMPGMGMPGMGMPGMGMPSPEGPPSLTPPMPGDEEPGEGMGLPSPITPPMPGGGPPVIKPGLTIPGAAMPGMGFPGMELPGTGRPEPKSTQGQATSHLSLGMIGSDLLIAIDLNWTDATYRGIIAPRLASLANQVKGKMAIFSSEFSWHALAAAGPKYAAEHKAFPRGTIDRGSNVNRFGLPYPPYQRVSFFYELLPYLGRGALKDSLSPKLAWYDEKNLPTAGQDRAAAWVPELLVPYYPQAAWRATSPLAPEHVLGATNYVAVAGVGLDVARQNPNSPEFKKLAGITGYDWGSKLDEITDGPANTIYLIQTPPGLQQPWIAGGGATVRGLHPDDPMAGFRYQHPNGKGGTREGTYALMADGAVRWIPANIDPKALKAMATRAGGDNADIGDIDKVAPKVEVPRFEKTELKTEPEKPAEKEVKPEGKKPEEKKPEGKDAKTEAKAADPKASDKKEPALAPKEKKD